MAIDVLRQSEERFRADPSMARISPSVSATIGDGRTRLTAGSFAWDADLPTSLGGGNAAPSPTAYLLGALAGCAVAFIKDTLAPTFGVRIDDVTAVARSSGDLRGLLGMDDIAPDLGDIEIEIRISSPDPEDRTGPMLRAWEERCPILLALRKPMRVAVSSSVTS